MHNFKLRHPQRDQVEMALNSLDSLIPADHRARDIWEFVENMDTSACFQGIKTFHGEVGRPATSPKVLLALWLYSILDGNASARKLEELCQYHNAYKWLAGGVAINRTMLADFRSQNPLKFEDLLTSCLAVLVKAGLLADKDFSQDGTRIRACAGASSFRREASLESLKKTILDRIKELETEIDPKAAYEARKKSNRIRVEQERKQRVEEALENLQKACEEKIENGEKHRTPPKDEDLKEMRASTTDPEARKMKMADGGFRPAYNLQFATGLESRVIFGVTTVNTLDPGTATQMMAKVDSKLSKLGLPRAKHWIADSAYSGKDDVEQTDFWFPDCIYYGPPKPRKGVDPKKERRSDSAAVKKWRSLIGDKAIEEVYTKRCSTAEWVNAQVKNKGLVRFFVRGIEKVQGMALLHVIALNITRFWDLSSKQEVAENLMGV